MPALSRIYVLGLICTILDKFLYLGKHLPRKRPFFQDFEIGVEVALLSVMDTVLCLLPVINDIGVLLAETKPPY